MITAFIGMRLFWNCTLELRDGLVHIHGVALVIEPQNCAVVAPERTDGLGYAGEARVSVRVLLGKDRDLLGFSRRTFTK